MNTLEKQLYNNRLKIWGKQGFNFDTHSNKWSKIRLLSTKLPKYHLTSNVTRSSSHQYFSNSTKNSNTLVIKENYKFGENKNLELIIRQDSGNYEWPPNQIKKWNKDTENLGKLPKWSIWSFNFCNSEEKAMTLEGSASGKAKIADRKMGIETRSSSDRAALKRWARGLRRSREAKERSCKGRRVRRSSCNSALFMMEGNPACSSTQR